MTAGKGLSRRRLLGAGAAAGGALALGGCAVGSALSSAPDERALGASGTAEAVRLAFHGEHQRGVTEHPPGKRSLAAAFTLVARDRDELRETFRALSDEIQALMEGTPAEERDPAFPPSDSGVLGAEPYADRLSVVASVGASLFDDRYGLADHRPRELVEMPFLANDRLDPERSHGDLLLSIEADHSDTVLAALRQLMRRTRRTLVLHWMLDGYSRATDPNGGGGAARNLMGFKDGTANLDGTDAATMDRYVWVDEQDGEPPWALGGSYHVVRAIRMLVESWDRAPLGEQEAIMGRHKASGSPLDGERETDVPDYGADPEGAVTPLDAHIRLANPRIEATEDSLLFRRGFSYSRGNDDAGQLDQGLCFVSYQHSLEQGFAAVQSRLDGEPLEEYIRPEGGGFYYALPGVPEPGRSLGDALLA